MAAVTHYFGTTFVSTNNANLTLYPSRMDETYFQVRLPIEDNKDVCIKIEQTSIIETVFSLIVFKTKLSDTPTIEEYYNISCVSTTYSCGILTIAGFIGVPWQTVATWVPQEWMAINGIPGINWVALISNIQDATSFIFFELTRPVGDQLGNLSVVIPVQNPHSNGAVGINPGSFYVTSHLTTEKYTLNVFHRDTSCCTWGTGPSKLWHISFEDGWMQPIQEEYFIGHTNGLSESSCSSVPFMDIIGITPYYNAWNYQCGTS